jgi:hypothetical protein
MAVLGYEYPPRLALVCVDGWLDSMLVGRSSGWGSAGSLSWSCTACGFLRYQRWMLALSWARASFASVGLSWGKHMSSSGKCGLPGDLLECAGVGGCCCVLLEDECSVT